VASLLHEAIVELLRNRPRLALELLGRVVPVPLITQEDGEGRIESGDLGDAKPLERAADFVASFGPHERPIRVIVEVQLRRDPEKQLSWPGYVAVSWARSAQRTYLVVLAIDAVTARWAAEPIDVGHFAFRPIVIGADAIPLIVDADGARRSPELSVLAVGMHRERAEVVRAAAVALEAVAELDEARARFYTALVVEWLPAAARAILEANMDIKTEFVNEVQRRIRAEAEAQARAEGEAKGRAEGQASAAAEAVLRVLAARGISVSETTAARVRECRDLERLNAWLELAVRVEKADSLFD
jgi:hypothetical protein